VAIHTTEPSIVILVNDEKLNGGIPQAGASTKNNKYPAADGYENMR
jgi:hypothetical protein